MKILSHEQTAALKRFCTPTVSNAIELFDVRPRTAGFLGPEIRAMYPDMAPMVAYAVTSVVRADVPARPEQAPLRAEYLRWVKAQPGPKVAVTQDLTEGPTGAFMGEVNGSLHRALGCVGHVTNGGVRDLDEVAALGFAMFASGPAVSHAYVHLKGFGEPVEIAGVTIRPGDLLHADKHGVCLVPHEVAGALADACAAFEAAEAPLIGACRSDPFDLDEFLRRSETFRKRAWSGFRQG